jgi:hypothetical protein
VDFDQIICSTRRYKKITLEVSPSRLDIAFEVLESQEQNLESFEITLKENLLDHLKDFFLFRKYYNFEQYFSRRSQETPKKFTTFQKLETFVLNCKGLWQQNDPKFVETFYPRIKLFYIPDKSSSNFVFRNVDGSVANTENFEKFQRTFLKIRGLNTFYFIVK